MAVRSATPARTGSTPARAATTPGRSPGWLRAWVSDRLAMAVAGLVLLYLFLPVGYTFVFSFNNYTKSNIVWNPAGSPTFKHWAHPCAPEGLCESLVTSLEVAVLATLIATVIGTMLAFALVRHRFSGRGAANLLVFLPMATPEIVLGASLLTIFVQGFTRIGLQLGFWTIVIAHVMFVVSFVVVSVKARLQSLDPRLEEAAQDLYADPGTTFRRVTFPLALPGIISGALLSFALSFDDFIITNFVSGGVNTFPKYVYVSYLRGIPAEANVIGFSMFAIAVLLVLAAQLIGDVRRRRALRAC